MGKKRPKATRREEPEGLRRDQAADMIRQLILTGALGFRSGNIVSEGQLERMGLTKGPSRQALSQLAREGLVTILPRVGTQVRVVTHDEAQAMMTIRFAIETIIVGELAVSRPDLRPLQEIHDGMTRIARDKSDADASLFSFIKEDMEFHATMAKLAKGYGPAAQPLKDLTSQFLLYASSTIRSSDAQDIMAEVIREHKDILAALKAGDSELARDCLHVHLRDAARRLDRYSCDYMDSNLPKYIKMNPIRN